MAVSKREATTILAALNTGVVPRVGLRHIAVGRLREIGALKQDLDHMREGGAAIRFVIGRFGSGKSFLLQLVRVYALDSRFVVADADFSPERRLQGSGNQALATYRELMRNLSTQTRPDGNALPAIVERWISSVQARVSAGQGLAAGTPEFNSAVEAEITKTVNSMEDLVHGFDFGQVINAYYRGYVEGNDALKGSAIRWLRGEYNTKSEAREALGVRTIVDDDNFYDYLKVMARFVHDVGYAGLLICLDEAVNLYKITHTQARNNNYEKLLSIVNDCLQGQVAYLGFVFGGTPEFLEDQRRGLFSYEALRTRLAGSRFATNGMVDYSSPVLSLPPLTMEEIFVLLQKVQEIHRSNVSDSRGLVDADIHAYMEATLQRIGAKEFATPRDLVREFVAMLNLLAQYPDKTWQEIAGAQPAQVLPAPETLPGKASEEAQVTLQNVQPPPTSTSALPQGVTGLSSVPPADDPLDRFTDFKVG